MATTKRRGKAPAKAAAKRAPLKRRGPPPVKQDALDPHEESIVEAFRNDEGYRSIAKKRGVSVSTLSAWIAKNPERSHACARARQDSARQCDERAEEEIVGAKDQFQLQRAKELAIHLRWRAKARDPGEFGDKVKVDGVLGVRIVGDEALLAELAKFGIAARIGPQPEPEAPGA